MINHVKTGSRNLDNGETLAYWDLLCHGIKRHSKNRKWLMIRYIKDEVRVWQSIFNARFFFFNGATVPSGLRPSHHRGFTITLRHTTFDRTPLDER
jgi:hypothetical protein